MTDHKKEFDLEMIRLVRDVLFENRDTGREFQSKAVWFSIRARVEAMLRSEKQENRLIFEMCASLCDQCKRELEGHGDIDVNSHDCGCHYHSRGLGGAEGTCKAGIIWNALYEAKGAIKKREEQP